MTGASPPTAATSPDPTRPASPPRRLAAKVARLASDIKLAHSVFALPFAILAAFLAFDPSLGWTRFVGQLLLILVCMVAARTWAMVANRLLDREFDRSNERTARRAFAAGDLTARDGVIALAASAGLFVLACAAFGWLFANWAPLWFSAPVLGVIAGYSLTKRFTALCHLVLGVSLALSPIAAAVAVGGLDVLSTADPGRALWSLAAMVLCWVAGFDIIYALQDAGFDRERGLSSIPAKLGWTGALWVSRTLHVVAAAGLVGVLLLAGELGPIFAVAVVAGVGLLVWQQAIVARRGAAVIGPAFFEANGLLSVGVGVLGVIDALV
ncbi:MAG: UbiA-like polyprenyltransferase [Planctomycetota bacterium]